MGAIEIFDEMVELIEPSDLEGLSDHEIVEAWQDVQGLPADGQIGPVTERKILAPRFCGVRDRLMINGKICRWDHAKWDGSRFTVDPAVPCVTKYFVNGKAKKLTKQQTDNGIAEAAGLFGKVSALQLVPIQTPEGANLVIDFGEIDGASSVLAWCELPCGKDTTKTKLKMLVDDDEPWVISVSPESGYIDFVRVIRHELGHFVGMDHIAAGNLLAPYYDQNIRDFQAGDIKELVKRYGPAIVIAPPDLPPSMPPAIQVPIDIKIGGQTWGGMVSPGQS